MSYAYMMVNIFQTRSSEYKTLDCFDFEVSELIQNPENSIAKRLDQFFSSSEMLSVQFKIQKKSEAVAVKYMHIEEVGSSH